MDKKTDIFVQNYRGHNTAKIMGGKNKRGESVSVNSRFIVKNGFPWLPVMGEIHYLRIPKIFWKDALLKMKAGGINIISTYVFWIYHEEIEGEFIWDNDHALSLFLHLCKELDLCVILRIGPWSHGEVRNGGYPDWLLKKNFEAGTNNDEYFSYTKKFYSQIFEQSKAYLFKNGGSIVGIQIDNEYGHCHGHVGKEGILHMSKLKQIAVDIGFDVPLYTATGWGGGIVVEGEMVPVMAAYAEGSWAQHIDTISPSPNYIFTSIRDDMEVGSDLSSVKKYDVSYSIDKNPYLMCELGGGMQANYQRRPIITADDTECMAFVKLGSGANMLGYYMYHGGTNGVGIKSTLQESRETGYQNDLPTLSYDYQAAIGEYGLVGDTYDYLNILHLFLNDFGEYLATTDTFIPNENSITPNDINTLRYSVRHNENDGFIFINNYQRSLKMSDHYDIFFRIDTGRDDISFEKLDILSGQRLILPYNMTLGDIRLISVTAQPLCHLNIESNPTYVFFSYQNASFILDRNNVKSISASSGEIIYDTNRVIVGDLLPGDDCVIDIYDNDDNLVKILLITRSMAENAQKIEVNDCEYLFISKGHVVKDNGVKLTALCNVDMSFKMFPQIEDVDTKDLKYNVSIKQELFSKIGVSHDIYSIDIYAKKEDDYWEINIPKYLSQGYDDVHMMIDYMGDTAEIYLDDKLVADNFYQGLMWKVGLRKFMEDLNDKQMKLLIKPMQEGAYVYLDVHPVFKDGEMMDLKSIRLVPECSLKLQIR